MGILETLKGYKAIIPLFAVTNLVVPQDSRSLDNYIEYNLLEVEEPKDTITISTIDSTLVKAMIHVESGGIEDMVGDKQLIIPSIGVLQIRPIMVREINRILKKQDIKKKYKLKDRFNREKSIEMFYIWKDFHHKKDSDEVIARCWNGGPKGWKRKSTEWYWTKVSREINKINPKHGYNI
jgi:hypothetical protein